jgi:hypothetical protein
MPSCWPLREQTERGHERCSHGKQQLQHYSLNTHHPIIRLTDSQRQSARPNPWRSRAAALAQPKACSVATEMMERG